MNSYFIMTIFQFLKAQRIVKIFCILGIYRERKHITHIPTLLDFRFLNTGIQLVGITFNIFRKFMGQTILCKNGVDLGLVIARFSKNPNDLAKRRVSFFWPVIKFNKNLISILGITHFRSRNKEIGIHPIIVDNYKTKILFLLKNTNKFGLLTLNDLRDFSFRSFSSSAIIHIDLNFITIKRRIQIFASNKNIICQLFNHHVTVPLTRNI